MRSKENIPCGVEGRQTRDEQAQGRGTLKSGSGKKVTSRKQAIAIGLSEARKKGKKVAKKKASWRASSHVGVTTVRCGAKVSTTRRDMRADLPMMR